MSSLLFLYIFFFVILVIIKEMRRHGKKEIFVCFIIIIETRYVPIFFLLSYYFRSLSNFFFFFWYYKSQVKRNWALQSFHLVDSRHKSWTLFSKFQKNDIEVIQKGVEFVHSNKIVIIWIVLPLSNESDSSPPYLSLFFLTEKYWIE